MYKYLILTLCVLPIFVGAKVSASDLRDLSMQSRIVPADKKANLIYQAGFFNPIRESVRADELAFEKGTLLSYFKSKVIDDQVEIEYHNTGQKLTLSQADIDELFELLKKAKEGQLGGDAKPLVKKFGDQKQYTCVIDVQRNRYYGIGGDSYYFVMNVFETMEKEAMKKLSLRELWQKYLELQVQDNTVTSKEGDYKNASQADKETKKTELKNAIIGAILGYVQQVDRAHNMEEYYRFYNPYETGIVDVGETQVDMSTRGHPVAYQKKTIGKIRSRVDASGNIKIKTTYETLNETRYSSSNTLTLTAEQKQALLNLVQNYNPEADPVPSYPITQTVKDYWGEYHYRYTFVFNGYGFEVTVVYVKNVDEG